MNAALPGYEYVASGSENGRVIVWRRGHSVPIQKLLGHASVVNTVSSVNLDLTGVVSTHKKQYWALASASDDHSVILWL